MAYYGNVVLWMFKKQFGFVNIKNADFTEDVFVHATDFADPAQGDMLQIGELIHCDVEADPDKPSRFRARRVTGPALCFDRDTGRGGGGTARVPPPRFPAPRDDSGRRGDRDRDRDRDYRDSRDRFDDRDRHSRDRFDSRDRNPRDRDSRGVIRGPNDSGGQSRPRRDDSRDRYDDDRRSDRYDRRDDRRDDSRSSRPRDGDRPARSGFRQGGSDARGDYPKGLLTGEVVTWNSQKGFGFVRSPDYPSDVFVHRQEIRSSHDMPNLTLGDSIDFRLALDNRANSKLHAIDVEGPAVTH